MPNGKGRLVLARQSEPWYELDIAAPWEGWTVLISMSYSLCFIGGIVIMPESNLLEAFQPSSVMRCLQAHGQNKQD